MTQVQDLRRCIVCGKRCEPSDKNTDGTYAHRSCLYLHIPPRRPA
jgi:hypothetical protein